MVVIVYKAVNRFQTGNRHEISGIVGERGARNKNKTKTPNTTTTKVQTNKQNSNNNRTTENEKPNKLGCPKSVRPAGCPKPVRPAGCRLSKTRQSCRLRRCHTWRNLCRSVPFEWKQIQGGHALRQCHNAQLLSLQQEPGELTQSHTPATPTKA